jgi:F-type H+-transporting ATPase subunit a
MAEHKLWLTIFLNQHFGASVTAFLRSLGIQPATPATPIPDHLVMEVLIVIFIMALLAAVRARLSSDHPGHMQQLLEMTVDWIESQVDEIVGHEGRVFVPLLFTLFVFILLSNISGEIPYLGTPTKAIFVTVGASLVSLVYYHYHGVRHHGVLGYLRTFMGPVLAIGPLMFLIEIVSHLARGLSLSVRLFANMVAGENITEIFFHKLYGLALPLLPMFLHIFVGALQAYIFVLLTMIYLAGAVSHEH